MGKDENSNAQVTPCPGSATSFCCGRNNTACCNTATEIVIPTIDDPSFSSTSSSTSVSPSSAPSKSATPSPTRSLRSSSPSQSTTKIIIVAVVVVGVALLATATLVFVLMRRKTRQKENAPEARMVQEDMSDLEIDKSINAGVRTELHDQSRTAELHTASASWELPTTNE